MSESLYPRFDATLRQSRFYETVYKPTEAAIDARYAIDDSKRWRVTFWRRRDALQRALLTVVDMIVEQKPPSKSA